MSVRFKEGSSRSQTRGLYRHIASSRRGSGCVRKIASLISSAEFSPVGALEKDIIADVARLTWRKQHLAISRIAQFGASAPSRD